MALGSVSSPVADKFRADLPKEMIDSPWNYSKTYEDGKTGNYGVRNLQKCL